MRSRIYNARIITMELPMEVKSGEVWIKDDVIEYVGCKKETKEKFDKEIDAKGNLVMPGFKNAHAHCPMTFARSYADDLPLKQWLETKIFPIEAKLTDENIYVFSKLAYMEYLTSGITSAFNMYSNLDAIAKAAVDSNFRTVLCGTVNNFKDSVSLLDEHFQKFNNYDDLISHKLGFHAEYTTDLNLMKEIALLAEKYKVGVYVHNSETRLEVDECIKRYGKTPTQLFDEVGLYKYGGAAFHGVHLDDEDIEIIKKNNVHLVINSGSNLKLASGVAPVYKYLEKGVNLSLGTDGASSNNALDMFREMYLTSVLQKVSTGNAASCKAEDVLYMATVGGTNAMGLKDCDILAVGKKADLIMIDLNKPNMQPLNNIVNNLVYSGSKSNVKMTMINGKILYEDGKFLSIDEEEVYKEANKMMDSLR